MHEILYCWCQVCVVEILLISIVEILLIWIEEILQVKEEVTGVSCSPIQLLSVVAVFEIHRTLCVISCRYCRNTLVWWEGVTCGPIPMLNCWVRSPARYRQAPSFNVGMAISWSQKFRPLIHGSNHFTNFWFSIKTSDAQRLFFFLSKCVLAYIKHCLIKQE